MYDLLVGCYLSPFSARVICFVSGLIPFLFFLFQGVAVVAGCVFSNFYLIGGNALVLLILSNGLSRLMFLPLGRWTGNAALIVDKLK